MQFSIEFLPKLKRKISNDKVGYGKNMMMWHLTPKFGDVAMNNGDKADYFRTWIQQLYLFNVFWKMSSKML